MISNILIGLIAYFFVGNMVADFIKPNYPTRKSGEEIYQLKTFSNGAKIVHYRAYGMSTCRPQCYMSGTFKNAMRAGIPYPFRRGKYFECGKEGDLDFCTGEIYRDGKWIRDQSLFATEEEQLFYEKKPQ